MVIDGQDLALAVRYEWLACALRKHRVYLVGRWVRWVGRLWFVTHDHWFAVAPADESTGQRLVCRQRHLKKALIAGAISDGNFFRRIAQK